LLRAKSRRLNRVASTPAGDQRREPVLVVLLLDETTEKARFRAPLSPAVPG
jgi:hypothetical protein